MASRRQFDGFRQTDFTDEIRGSTWRGRLAVPLKSHLEVAWLTPCDIQHVQYHSEMYLDFYARRHLQAGFWLGMSEAGLTLRFRIERGLKENAGGTVMGDNWDWHRFLFKLRHPTERFLQAFQAAAVEGTLEILDGKGAQHAEVPSGSGVSDVLAAIQQFPEGAWLNLWITNTIEPTEAISWGAGVPGLIAERLEGRKRLALEVMSDD